MLPISLLKIKPQKTCDLTMRKSQNTKLQRSIRPCKLLIWADLLSSHSPSCLLSFSSTNLLALPQTLQERPCLWDLALTAFSSWTPLPNFCLNISLLQALNQITIIKAFPGHSKIWNRLPAPFSFPHFLLNSYQHHTFYSFYLCKFCFFSLIHLSI